MKVKYTSYHIHPIPSTKPCILCTGCRPTRQSGFWFWLLRTQEFLEKIPSHQVVEVQEILNQNMGLNASSEEEKWSSMQYPKWYHKQNTWTANFSSSSFKLLSLPPYLPLTTHCSCISGMPLSFLLPMMWLQFSNFYNWSGSVLWHAGRSKNTHVIQKAWRKGFLTETVY